MKMFNQAEGGDSPPSESATLAQDPAELKYRQELLEYNTYNQKLWKFRFLLVRVSVTLFNFFYHYINLSNFHASSYAYVRDLSSEKYPVRDFSLGLPLQKLFLWQLTIRYFILWGYFMQPIKTVLF